MPSEFYGQVRTSDKDSISNISVSLIKLNKDIPPFIGAASPYPDWYLQEQKNIVGYNIIATVKTNENGIWKIKTNEILTPLSTTLLFSKSDSNGPSYYDHEIFNPQSQGYGSDIPKYLPKDTIPQWVKDDMLARFLPFSRKCAEEIYKSSIDYYKRVLHPNPKYLSNGKFAVEPFEYKGLIGKTPQEAFDIVKSQIDEEWKNKCGSFRSSVSALEEGKTTFDYTDLIELDYKSAPQSIIQKFNTFWNFPIDFNLYNTLDLDSIHGVNMAYYDELTQEKSADQWFTKEIIDKSRNPTNRRNKYISEIVELNPAWEAEYDIVIPK